MKHPAGGRLLWAILLCLSSFAAPSLAGAQRAETTPSPGGVAGRSLVLPGWGQRELGQRRWWAYAAAEVVFWGVWAQSRRSGADLRREYRDLAWNTARVQSTSRTDGDFEYYERLTKWVRSGSYDADATRSGLQPEQDPSTFNGSIWVLASGLFFGGGPPPDEGSVEFIQALDYYRSRAYGPELLWDWTGQEGERSEFARLIQRSDDRFRRATTAAGAVLANHLLSATDAFVSARTRLVEGIRVSPDLRPAAGWTLVVRLRAP